MGTKYSSPLATSFCSGKPDKSMRKMLNELHKAEVLESTCQGKLYRAFNSGDKLTYLVKVIYSADFEPERLERLRYHLAYFSSQSFQHLIPIKCFVVEENLNIQLICPDCSKQTLRSVIDDTELVDFNKAIFIAYKIMRGLKELRNHGVTYRYLRPEQIHFKVLPCGEIVLKLTDFIFEDSLRKMLDDEHVLNLYYEKAPSKTYNKMEDCSDVWSLGCILYELLLGDHPLLSFGYDETLLRESKIASAGKRELPINIITLLKGMLTKDLKARFKFSQVDEVLSNEVLCMKASLIENFKVLGKQYPYAIVSTILKEREKCNNLLIQ